MSGETPETDEQFKSFPAYFEIDLFCRKLERERDEAREKYDNLAVENMLAVNKICGERDEAREEAHRFRSLNYSHLGINKSVSWFPWETSLNLQQKARLLETEKHPK